MTTIDAKQITLQNDGQVLYQADATNPLAGVPIATLVKGDHVCKPALAMIDGAALSAGDAATAVQMHLDTVLEPLAGMLILGELPEPIRAICGAIYEGCGIAAREDLQDSIAALDTEMRGHLRAKGVRLGPILAFCPMLNKPAAVRLRGLLWGVYHGMTLPVPLVPDGMVSQVVEADEALKGFYRAISYPVYGPRAIRIDMLDRVVNAVYELADKGQFKAQHQMAEWLGCPIADLYAVLESMGHKKMVDPANEVVEDVSEAVDAASVAGEAAVDADSVKAEEKAEKPAADVKPELATFRLKKGKAYQSASAAGGRSDKPKFKKADKPRRDDKKRKGGKKKDTSPRVMSAEAPKVADEDSPWAALAAFKK